GFEGFNRLAQNLKEDRLVGILEIVQHRALGLTAEGRRNAGASVVAHPVHQVEFRQEGAKTKDTKPGVPKVKVVPGNKGAIHQIVVVVENPLLLLINGKEGLVVEVIGLQRLEERIEQGVDNLNGIEHT